MTLRRLRIERLAPFLVLALLPIPARAVSAARAVTLADEVEAFLQVPAVVGREEPAAEFLRGRLAGLPVEQDALGNLAVTIGSGSPRRLVACPMGEPGYVVSRILDDGYLRLVPAGGGPDALWDQAHQGETVMIGGARGWVAGAVALPSVHLMQGPSEQPSDKPFNIDRAWVDVGAESSAEVAEMGIRLLDPVALIRRPSRLAGGRIAAPSARLKGACVALVEAARRLHASPGTGTTVFAWTALDLLNGKGLEYLVRRRGPFDEALLVSPAFEWKAEVSSRGPIDWGKARVGVVGLPAFYPGSPVETISFSDVERLADTLAGGKASSPPPLGPPPSIVAPAAAGHEPAGLLGTLIGRYGVSGAEGPVREEILRQLPSWAKPEVDEKGDVIVTIGQGKEHVLFVAHMDEVGFRVAEVLPDGRLRLEARGGLLSPVWEAQAALVHPGQDGKGPVPAVFEPRADWRSAEKYAADGPLTVYLGVASAQEAEALGIHAGSTVTMPKRMLRIGRHRVLARGFDDRVGCTALLLALRSLDPAKLTRRVTFSWAVEEEIGLNGSAVLAARFPDLTRVHPVDTFVSSDSPIETGRFAYTPLGRGPVLRAMDNSDQTPRPLLDRFLALAGRLGIPIQLGMTGGASDGLAFAGYGAEMLPFSWPGRYSHSPVEVADLRDVESLVRLVAAAATAATE